MGDEHGITVLVADACGGGGGGAWGEKGVAPRREEREVEMDNRSEASGEHEEVTDVATESEGSAGGAFENEPFAADECGGVAAADVGDGGDYVRKDYIRKVINGGGCDRSCH